MAKSYQPQRMLFDSIPSLPAGFVYVPDFITTEEEAALLEIIASLPLKEAKYKEYTAKRRIVSYGGSYDFSSNELIPAGEIPDFLLPLRERVAHLANVKAARFTHALIAEYKTGTQLGWHRDVPEFELVAGISLGSECRMRLRRYPAKEGRARRKPVDRSRAALGLCDERCSAMGVAAQHSADEGAALFDYVPNDAHQSFGSRF